MQRIALISEHASPLGVIGGVDAGGQNIYVANVAKQLAERGLDVDVYTRCDNAHLPEVVRIGTRMRVIHVPAGPPVDVPKEKLLPYMGAFADYMIARMRREPDPVDVMHANFFMSGEAALRVKKRLGIPLVTT
ncbi:glycosyl transferase family 1, partial [Burkholderia multivorans]